MANASVFVVVLLLYTVVLLMLNIDKARGTVIYPVRYGQGTPYMAPNQSGSVAPQSRTTRSSSNSKGHFIRFCGDHQGSLKDHWIDFSSDKYSSYLSGTGTRLNNSAIRLPDLNQHKTFYMRTMSSRSDTGYNESYNDIFGPALRSGQCGNIQFDLLSEPKYHPSQYMYYDVKFTVTGPVPEGTVLTFFYLKMAIPHKEFYYVEYACDSDITLSCPSFPVRPELSYFKIRNFKFIADHWIYMTDSLIGKLVHEYVRWPEKNDLPVKSFQIAFLGEAGLDTRFSKIGNFQCGNVTTREANLNRYLTVSFNGTLPAGIIFELVPRSFETPVQYDIICHSEEETSANKTQTSTIKPTITVKTTKEPEATSSTMSTIVTTTREPKRTTSALNTTVRPTKEPEPTPSAVMTTATPMETQTGKANAPSYGEGCKSKPLGAISGNDILNPYQGKDNVEKDSVNPQFYDDYSIRAKFPKSNTGEGKTVTYDISNVAGVGCVEIVYYVYTAGDISLKVDNHQSPVTNFGDQPTVADWTRRTAYYTRTGDSIKSLSITVKTPLWGDWTVQLAQISLFVGHTRIPPNFNLGCHLTMLSSIYGNALLAPQKGAMNVAEDRSNPSLFDNYPLRVKFPKSTSATGASVTYVVPLFSPSEDASCVEIVYYVYKGDGKMLFTVNDDTNRIDAVPFGNSSSQGGWERKTVYYKVPLNGASITSLSLNVKAKYVDLDWGVQLAAVTFFTGS